MAFLDPLFAYLRTGPAPDCDRILGAALEHAEDNWFDRIKRTLLERGNDAALGALIGCIDRLSPDERRRIEQDPQRFRAAVAEALASAAPSSRAAALRLLLARPCLRLAHCLPDALRDRSADVSKLAGQVLRRFAEVATDAAPPQPGGEDEQDRRRVVAALREALRTFDSHFRLEPVEACLWLARDIGPALWAALEQRNSQCGHVVEEHLSTWARPRAASFLLLALKQQRWRRPALDSLNRWHTLDDGRALLACADLLDDPQIARAVHGLKRPAWIFRLDGDAAADLPVELRAAIPRWIAQVTLNEEERVRMLARCRRGPCRRTALAALDALGRLKSLAARDELSACAAAGGPLAEYAAWCLAGRLGEPPATGTDSDVQAASAAATAAAGAERTGGESADGLDAASGASTSESPSRESADLPPAAGAFEMLWQVCRRKIVDHDAELLDVIRENSDRCAASIRQCLLSEDPHDRILALRVIATRPLARRFHAELRQSLTDPLEGIRRLAQKIIDAADAVPANPSKSDGTSSAETTITESAPESCSGPSAPAADFAESGKRLVSLLHELLDSQQPLAQLPELVQQVRQLAAITGLKSESFAERRRVETEAASQAEQPSAEAPPPADVPDAIVTQPPANDPAPTEARPPAAEQSAAAPSPEAA